MTAGGLSSIDEKTDWPASSWVVMYRFMFRKSFSVGIFGGFVWLVGRKWFDV